MSKAARFLLLTLVLGLLVLMIFGALRRNEARPPAAPDDGGQPNIVLISIDTWRGDYFTPEHMPKTYRWAKENAAIFDRAYSNSVWTLPSHVTMLTGMLQSQHGVEFNDSIIPESTVMIQQELKKAGYKTLAFVQGGYVDGAKGFSRGFDRFSIPPISDKAYKPEELKDIYWASMEEAAQAISELEDSAPYFIFIHTYFMHDYWIDHYKDDAIIPSRETARKAYWKIHDEDIRRKSYGNTARECDQRLFEFIQKLYNSNLSSNLRLIITSDHGEGLGDRHGPRRSWNHNGPPFSSQLHVPLIVDGIRKGRYDNLIGIHDVPAIIRKFADLERGSSLPENDFILSEYLQPNPDHPSEPRELSVTFPEKKLLLLNDGSLLLFTGRKDEVNVLKAKSPQIRQELSDELKKDLKALGYLN